jgi:hypothetical protein
MIPINPQEPFTPFLPTTYNIPEEDDRLHAFLVDQFCDFADVINDKVIGNFVYASENFNGDKFSYKTTLHPQTSHVRNGFQSITYFPSLVSGVFTRSTTPQYPLTNVNDQLVITQLYGTASKPPSALSAGDGDYFQYNNRGDPRITFDMSDTTITITTTTDLSAYSGFIIVKYLKDGT